MTATATRSTRWASSASASASGPSRVQSGIAMLVGFGLAWTGEQVGLVVGFSAAVLGWIARSQVTPNIRVER